MADESGKRIISLGFERPKELKGDNIYVDFNYHEGHHQVSATAYSNEPFAYHTPAIAGNRLTFSERHATTYTGNRENSWQLDYNKFIEDLADSNNGKVVDQRLIEDGSRLVARILQAGELLHIRFPHCPTIGTEEKP